MYEDPPTSTKEFWISVLKLSTLFHFEALRDVSVTRLQVLASAIDKVVLSREYDVQTWLESALVDVCENTELPSEAECHALGFDTYRKIIIAREAMRQPFSLIGLSTTRTQTIRNVFGIESHVRTTGSSKKKKGKAQKNGLSETLQAMLDEPLPPDEVSPSVTASPPGDHQAKKRLDVVSPSWTSIARPLAQEPAGLPRAPTSFVPEPHSALTIPKPVAVPEPTPESMKNNHAVVAPFSLPDEQQTIVPEPVFSGSAGIAVAPKIKRRKLAKKRGSTASAEQSASVIFVPTNPEGTTSAVVDSGLAPAPSSSSINLTSLVTNVQPASNSAVIGVAKDCSSLASLVP
jgi:hypothetical protein